MVDKKAYACIEELQMELTLYPNEREKILKEAGREWRTNGL